MAVFANGDIRRTDGRACEKLRCRVKPTEWTAATARRDATKAREARSKMHMHAALPMAARREGDETGKPVSLHHCQSDLLPTVAIRAEGKFAKSLPAAARWRGHARSFARPRDRHDPPLPSIAVTVLVSRARSVGGAAVVQGRATAANCRHRGRADRAGRWRRRFHFALPPPGWQ